jgi:hypothetical protein
MAVGRKAPRGPGGSQIISRAPGQWVGRCAGFPARIPMEVDRSRDEPTASSSARVASWRPRGACRGSARAFHSRFSRHNRQGGVKWEISVAAWKTQLLEVKCFELCFPCCHTSKTEREQRGRGRAQRARRPLSTRGARRTGSGGEGLVAARTAHCALGWNRLRRLYVASIQ